MAKKKASAKKVQTKKKSTQVSKAAPKKAVKSVGKKAKAKSSAKKVAKTVAKKTTKKVTKKIVKKSSVKATSKKIAPKAAKATSKKVTTAKKTPSKANSLSVQKHMAPAKSKGPDLKSLIGKLQPLDDRVLVALGETEKMTAGGLYIPATVSDVSGNLKGTVVAVGRGHQNKKGHVKNMDVQVGDEVLFSEYAGSKVKLDNSELVMLRETEILGIVSK